MNVNMDDTACEHNLRPSTPCDISSEQVIGLNCEDNKPIVAEIDHPVTSYASPGQTINIQAEDGSIYRIKFPENSSSDAVSVEHVTSSMKSSTNITVNQTEINSSDASEEKTKNNETTYDSTASAFILGTLVGAGVVMAGVSLYGTARIDNIGEKLRSTMKKLSDMNQDYKITEQATLVGKDIVHRIKETDTKYKFTEKTTIALTSTLHAGTKRLSKLTGSSESSSLSKQQTSNSEASNDEIHV